MHYEIVMTMAELAEIVANYLNSTQFQFSTPVRATQINVGSIHSVESDAEVEVRVFAERVAAPTPAEQN